MQGQKREKEETQSSFGKTFFLKNGFKVTRKGAIALILEDEQEI